jgi:pyridoxal phosphate enzyme (YggS family)
MVPRKTPSSPADRLAANLADVKARIEAAAGRASRDPAGVTLLVVTKGVPVEALRRLPDLGVSEVGESRIQEAGPKIDVLGDVFRWHLIGHLQRNKARRAIRGFTLIHSVESMKLLDHLDRIAGELGRKVSVLLQVNISEEGQKYGIEPGEVRSFLSKAAARERVEIRGLMGMAPYVAAPEECRSCFSHLARIRDEANAASWYRRPLPELSMGMTNDFEIAVEEGATIVRVGTAVFRDVDPSPATDVPPM